MQPYLSIITINYNDAEGLKRTLQTVFDQSYRNFEHIIIDGASTDGSKEIIEAHQKNFTYWVSEPDEGIFNAMNKGIKAAKGTYLQFLNSGDVLNGESALEEFLSHEDFGGDIIYGDYEFENGGKVYADDLYPYYFMKTSLPHQSTLFKKTVFDLMGPYDEKYTIAADRAFYIKCFMSGQFIFQHIKYPLTKFDLSGISNDPKLLKKKQEQDETIFKEYFGIHYPELANRRAAEQKQKRAERNSFTGILKRIQRRLLS